MAIFVSSSFTYYSMLTAGSKHNAASPSHYSVVAIVEASGDGDGDGDGDGYKNKVAIRSDLTAQACAAPRKITIG
jgi:hypothetical protein